jgi:hypothetical protein
MIRTSEITLAKATEKPIQDDLEVADGRLSAVDIVPPFMKEISFW